MRIYQGGVSAKHILHGMSRGPAIKLRHYPLYAAIGTSYSPSFGDFGNQSLTNVLVSAYSGLTAYSLNEPQH